MRVRVGPAQRCSKAVGANPINGFDMCGGARLYQRVRPGILAPQINVLSINSLRHSKFNGAFLSVFACNVDLRVLKCGHSVFPDSCSVTHVLNDSI